MTGHRLLHPPAVTSLANLNAALRSLSACWQQRITNDPIIIKTVLIYSAKYKLSDSLLSCVTRDTTPVAEVGATSCSSAAGDGLRVISSTARNF